MKSYQAGVVWLSSYPAALIHACTNNLRDLFGCVQVPVQVDKVLTQAHVLDGNTMKVADYQVFHQYYGY